MSGYTSGLCRSLRCSGERLPVFNRRILKDKVSFEISRTIFSLQKTTPTIAKNTMEFEEIGNLGYMGHNGGFQFRQISDSEYEYRATVQEYHLNSGGITHGGFIMSLIDSGLGTAVFRLLGGEKRIATISLNVNFVAASHKGETLIGSAQIIKKTRSMVFIRGELYVNDNVIATGDGIWKILTP